MAEVESVTINEALDLACLALRSYVNPKGLTDDEIATLVALNETYRGREALNTAGEYAAMREEAYPDEIEYCEVGECDEEAEPCECGNAHCPSHPHEEEGTA